MRWAHQCPVASSNLRSKLADCECCRIARVAESNGAICCIKTVIQYFWRLNHMIELRDYAPVRIYGIHWALGSSTHRAYFALCRYCPHAGAQTRYFRVCRHRAVRGLFELMCESIPKHWLETQKSMISSCFCPYLVARFFTSLVFMVYQKQPFGCFWAPAEIKQQHYAPARFYGILILSGEIRLNTFFIKGVSWIIIRRSITTEI